MEDNIALWFIIGGFAGIVVYALLDLLIDSLN